MREWFLLIAWTVGPLAVMFAGLLLLFLLAALIAPFLG